MTKSLATIHTRLRALKGEQGATAVEYGLMVALIAAVIIAVVAALGGQLVSLFQQVVNAI